MKGIGFLTYGENLEMVISYIICSNVMCLGRGSREDVINFCFTITSNFNVGEA